MKNEHFFFCKLHLGFIEYIEVLQTDVVFFVEETLLLNSCHVQEIKTRHNVFKFDDFLIGKTLGIKHFSYIVRNLKLLGGNKNKMNTGVSGKSINKRVDSTSEFKIATKADSKITKLAI